MIELIMIYLMSNILYMVLLPILIFGGMFLIMLLKAIILCVESDKEKETSEDDSSSFSIFYFEKGDCLSKHRSQLLLT